MDILLYSDYIDPDFWLLPQLQTAWVEWTQINQSSFNFETFNGYSDSLTSVSLSSNTDICGANSSSTITIDDITYDGFDYLDDIKANA